jgi:hypothetical protein
MERCYHDETGGVPMSIPQDALPVRKVAGLLTVSAMTVYRAMKGGAGGIGPGLRSFERGGKKLVSLGEAREYLTRHSRVDVGAVAGPGADALADELAKQLPTDPDSVIRRLATDPALVESLGHARARVMVQAGEAHRRAKQAEAAAAKMLTPDEFVTNLHGFGMRFCEHVEEIGARRLTSKIITLMRQHFNVDLSAHAGSASIIEHAIRVDHNVSLSEFRRECEEECRRVRQLDFGARDSAPTTEPQQEMQDNGAAVESPYGATVPGPCPGTDVGANAPTSGDHPAG